LGKKEAKKDSLFYAKNLSMKSNIAFSIYVDGKKNFYKDARVRIAPKGLRIIVGKERKI